MADWGTRPFAWQNATKETAKPLCEVIVKQEKRRNADIPRYEQLAALATDWKEMCEGLAKARPKEAMELNAHASRYRRLAEAICEVAGTLNNPEGKLTDRDHTNMDAFLGYVLDDYKAGEITKVQALGALAHVMAALDLDNYDEARSCFEQGRKFIQQES